MAHALDQSTLVPRLSLVLCVLYACEEILGMSLRHDHCLTFSVLQATGQLPTVYKSTETLALFPGSLLEMRLLRMVRNNRKISTIVSTRHF